MGTPAATTTGYGGRVRERRTDIATLKDVARRAGVDPSTASRVLRGDSGQHAKEETRTRIFEAASELGYQPNALARSLRTRRTGTIGLLVPSLDHIGYASVTHGIQLAAAEAGRLLLVVEAEAVPTEDDHVADQVYERLVNDGLVDGLLVAFETLPDRHLARLTERGIPMVLVNRQKQGARGSVIVDDLRGARMAIEHLIGLGHRRIAYLGLDLSTTTAERRLRGYLDALTAVGIEADERLTLRVPRSIEGGHDGVPRLLKQAGRRRPTAIFAASPMSALGARAALLEAGLRIPEDISLITFNDHPLYEHTAPPLTTVAMPNVSMGREAVRMLVLAIDGKDISDVMIDEAPELVVRASTASP